MQRGAAISIQAKSEKKRIPRNETRCLQFIWLATGTQSLRGFEATKIFSMIFWKRNWWNIHSKKSPPPNCLNQQRTLKFDIYWCLSKQHHLSKINFEIILFDILFVSENMCKEHLVLVQSASISAINTPLNLMKKHIKRKTS